MTPAFDAASIRIFQGTIWTPPVLPPGAPVVPNVLEALPSDTYNCIVTSPVFWSLRSYLAADDPMKPYELGSEPTPEAYIDNMVRVFREVRRVLHPTGVCFIEIGDTMAGGNGAGAAGKELAYMGDSIVDRAKRGQAPDTKPGEPVNIPFRLAEALRADGWYWRTTIVWHHVSCKPESVSGWRWEKCRVKVKAQWEKGTHPSQTLGLQTNPDQNPSAAVWRDCPGCDKCRDTGGYVLRKGKWRPTKAESYILMMTKSEQYFCDASQVKEPAEAATLARNTYSRVLDDPEEQYAVAHDHEFAGATRNPRSVQPFPPEPNTLTACKKCLYVTTGPELRKLPKKGKKPVCPNCGGTEWAGHYAAFPKAIPAFAIRAACSPKGRCPTCGTPWSPVVETGELVDDESGCRGTKASDDLVGRWNTGDDRWAPNRHQESRTLGHRPSCNCQVPIDTGGQNQDGSWITAYDYPEPEPCKVLDPFAGSATSLVAAYEAGCHADGLELNPIYVAMSAFRLNQSMVPRGQAQAQDAPGPLFGETT